MPEATLRFRIAAEPATLRRLLSDPAFLAESVPQVVAVEKTSETTALWTVLVKIGPISRKSVYRGELLDATDGGVRFRATGPEATIEGTVTFSAGTGGTDVELRLSMKGSGPLGSVVDAYLAKRVRADAETFAESLRTRVGGPPSGPA